MREVAAIALEADEPRRLRVLAPPLFLDLCLVVLAQAAQPAPPAFGIAADDRGLDDQPLPLPRRAQGAVDDRRVVVDGRAAAAVSSVRGVGWLSIGIRRQIVGRRQDFRRRSVSRLRDLGEREVLGEADADSRSTRAAEDGEEGAAGRVWAPGAAIEPGVDARALERVLEQAEILARRAQEHRHLVELHAAARLVENAPRDLDALASLAWRREEPDVAARLALGRLARGEERATQRRQVRSRRRNEGLDLGAERFRYASVARSPNGIVISVSGAAAISWLRQAELDGGFHRHVEEQQRQRGHAATPSLARLRRAPRGR